MNTLNLKEVEIESIEEIEYEEEVYLLEVEKDHNYFVENILSKNCQNVNTSQLKMIMSRIGEGSKIIMCGDIDQIDLRRKEDSGLKFLIDHSFDYYIEGLCKYELVTEHRKQIIIDILEEFKKHDK